MADATDEEGRLYALLEKLFKEIDQEAIRAQVVSLREAKPQRSREQIADELTKKAAVRVAGAGAAAGVAGGPLGILAMAPDIFNLVLQQSRLVLSIAFLYDQKPNRSERFREVLATLAVATGASAGRQGVRLLIRKGLERAAAGKLAKRIFGRFLVRRLPAVAPVLGTVAGGTINYFSMRAVGRAAVSYYAGKKLESAARDVKPRSEAASPKERSAEAPRKRAARKTPAKKAAGKKPAAKKKASAKGSSTKQPAPRKRKPAGGSTGDPGAEPSS